MKILPVILLLFVSLLAGCGEPEIHAWSRVQVDDVYKLETHEYVVVNPPTNRQEALNLIVHYLKNNPIKSRVGYTSQAVFYKKSNDTPVQGDIPGLKLNEKFPGGDHHQTETDISSYVIATVSWDGNNININFSNDYRQKGDSYCSTQINSKGKEIDTCTPIADLK